MNALDLAVRVGHVVRGVYAESDDVEHRSRDLGIAFTTPRLDLDALVWPRSEPGPAFDLPIGEVIDFLVETGRRLDIDRNPMLADALKSMVEVNSLGKRILKYNYRQLPVIFDRSALELQVDQIGVDALDGWRPIVAPNGTTGAVRAFPPRLVHAMAGNAPAVAAMTIVRGALTKGVNLLKMPSNDLFTATAILRTMADIDPTHPVLRSFSAAYWRGGDASVESVLYRPQYFDKLVVWGGDAAVRNMMRYLGPGLDLISFDPKLSASFIGREAFQDGSPRHEVTVAAAIDAAVLNQDACVASRYQFIEAPSLDAADRYCAALATELAVDRELSSAHAPAPAAEFRNEIEVLRQLEPDYKVFGVADGSGLVIRSEYPVDVPLQAKTVNVVPVNDIASAIKHLTVATQTVGVFPDRLKPELRDRLASVGVQRIVSLGSAAVERPGMPHDNIYPLHRLMRWVSDEAPPLSDEAPPPA